MPALHPRQVLLGAQANALSLPVCDHYCGRPELMRKSLALQAEHAQRTGRCVFDVTLDCDDGAPAGGEAEHAALVVELLHSQQRLAAHQASAAPRRQLRVGVRVHPYGHPAFALEVQTIVGGAAAQLAYLMLPQVDSVAQVLNAARAIDAAGGAALPLHVLVESPRALLWVHELAALERVESISFGLMDFVSAHGGAIPASAMGFPGQFEHPLVRRAKLEVASACHAWGKVASHCVVTELHDRSALQQAAQRAAQQFGYQRMWSIHPQQIDTILKAFAPAADEVALASEIILSAMAAQWGPIAHQGRLHDRASYRYHWQVLERAYASAVVLDAALLTLMQSPVPPAPLASHAHEPGLVA